MRLNPHDIPLSRLGSYLCVTSTWDHRRSPDEGSGWYVRWLRDAANTYVFHIELLDDAGHCHGPTRAEASVGLLRLGSALGVVCDLTLADGHTLRIRVRGGGVRMITVPGAYCGGAKLGERFWEVAPAAAHPRIGVRARRGRLSGQADWCDDGKAVACRSVVVAQVAREFEDWYTAFDSPTFPNGSSHKLAAYVLWVSTVSAGGLYPSPVVWGSKNWMTRVWAWDHCFTALGLACADPALAWDQFRLMIPMQGPGGMLCDVLGPHTRHWFCTKSPVHGWTLSHLRRLIPSLTRWQREEIYQPMLRWTDFWLTHRDLDGSGLPTILHPNEAFDNTTHTATHGPCKPPEHAAYVVLQCEAMAKLAEELGRGDDARRMTWAGRRVLDAMLRELWDDRRFVARAVADGSVPPGESVWQYVPLLLGQRLPADVQRKMIAGLTRPGGVWTEHGLATEALDSPMFDATSNVRGPIWTPPNWFLAEALDLVGESEPAAALRRNYLATLTLSGMSESFDAHSGCGREDPAYNWTAASYLWMTAPDA